jgi:hypothetical protein
MDLAEAAANDGLTVEVLDLAAEGQALPQAVDGILEAPLVAVGETEAAQRHALLERGPEIAEARQAPLQALHRPVGLAVLAAALPSPPRAAPSQSRSPSSWKITLACPQ